MSNHASGTAYFGKSGIQQMMEIITGGNIVHRDICVQQYYTVQYRAGI